VRRDIAALLNKLWPISNYKKYLTDLIISQSHYQMSQKFLTTVLRYRPSVFMFYPCFLAQS
jgi:hypothetical protein